MVCSWSCGAGIPHAALAALVRTGDLGSQATREQCLRQGPDRSALLSGIRTLPDTGQNSTRASNRPVETATDVATMPGTMNE